MSEIPSASSDPFVSLGLEACFALDEKAVDAAWMRRLRAAHPDRAGGDAEAARLAAVLNDARARLRDPLRRGEALLARLGESDAASESALPPAFLPEMLELRERLAEAAAASEDEAIAALAAEAEASRREVLARLEAAFAAPAPDAAAVRAIRLELNVLRYFDRLREELRHAPRDRA